MLESHLADVRARIARACAAADRPATSVTLLAVTKTVSADAIRAAFAAGQRRFGENYVQEGIDKIDRLADLRSTIEWHLIGPVQSNKTRLVAERFDWVDSIDRLKIARRLSEQRPDHLPPLQICLQVNISGEPTKSGLLPAEVADVARAVAKLPHLRLRGLMAIPEPAATFEAQRLPLRALRQLWLACQSFGLDLDTLSMGMTADLEAAIAEGATLVRVGTGVFGPRDASTVEPSPTRR